MTLYAAPVDHLRFTLDHIADFRRQADRPGFDAWTPETTHQWLTSAGRFFADVWAPTNAPADASGARKVGDAVQVHAGFDDVYRRTMQGGWNVLPKAPDTSGPGVPWTVHAAGIEMMSSANGSLSMLTGLIAGAIELLERHASAAQQALYLPRLRSGEWAGAMDLSEPQAGSDLGSLRSRAVRHSDGSYRLYGEKRFISWGDHALTPNIVHLVLARTADAPPGTAGISCFIVSKYMVQADGQLGPRNDIRCAEVEQNMGFRASPTCVMRLGDDQGAIAHLIGREGDGMRIMFTMMNSNRLATALGAMGIAERAYQAALTHARTRVQGVPPGCAAGSPITHHPDVRRMLMVMRCQIDGMRALCYYLAGCFDIASQAPSADERQHFQALADLLTPLAKSWCTDIGSEVTSLAIQLHGGSGFVEATGVAQHYRDIRIMSIFEGTNGIQAQDLVTRKLGRQGGTTFQRLLQEVQSMADAWLAGDTSDQPLGRALAEAVDATQGAGNWLLGQGGGGHPAALAGATAFQRLLGGVVVAYLLAKGAQAARQMSARPSTAAPDYPPAFLHARVQSAQFFAQQVLPLSLAHARLAMAGDGVMFAYPESML